MPEQRRREFDTAEVRRLGRRTVIAGGAGAVITVALRSFIARQFTTLGEQLGASDAQQLFRSMFSAYRDSSGTTLFSGRRDYAAGLHPENAAATVTLRRLLGLVDRTEETRDEVSFSPEDHLVIVGGTNSNVRTMIAWEATGPDMDTLARPEERGERPIIPLRWFGSSDRSDPVVLESGPVGWRMEGQGLVSTVNWVLHDTETGTRLAAARASRSERDKNGRPTHALLSNHLFITRLPNFLHPRFPTLAPSSWPYMLVVQGMHGPGTRAVELLATGRALPALQAAHDRLAGSTAYQILFEVSGLGSVRGRGGYYNAFHDITLLGVHDLQRVVGPGQFAAAHTYAVRRLQRADPWNA